MNLRIVYVALSTISLFLTGCASIFDGGPKTVQINSNPEGAKVTISNRTGKEVAVRTTPTTVTLERAEGPFQGEDYTLHFEADGYYPYEAHVQSTLDGWYLGNVFFGGLIGLVFIDPMTGDMFTLSPRAVTCNLIPVQASSTGVQTNSRQTETNPSASNESSQATRH